MPETSEYTRLGDGRTQSLFSRWQYLTRLEKGLIIITTVFGIVIFSLAIALAKCDSQVPPTPSPNVTTIAPETTTASTTSAPSSTTPAPSSTTPTPSSTTPAPSSTTAAPSSTTPAPSSTTPAPSSTTPAPSSTTPAPSSTTPAPSSTTASSSPTTPTTTHKPPVIPSNKTENTSSGNVKQINIELTTSSDATNSTYTTQTPQNETNLLTDIPPIPVTGNKLMSTPKDETNTNQNLTESTSEIPENNKDTLLSRQKRV